jgi:hypothetical protein
MAESPVKRGNENPGLSQTGPKGFIRRIFLKKLVHDIFLTVLDERYTNLFVK